PVFGVDVVLIETVGALANMRVHIDDQVTVPAHRFLLGLGSRMRDLRAGGTVRIPPSVLSGAAVQLPRAWRRTAQRPTAPFPGVVPLNMPCRVGFCSPLPR